MTSLTLLENDVPDPPTAITLTDVALADFAPSSKSRLSKLLGSEGTDGIVSLPFLPSSSASRFLPLLLPLLPILLKNPPIPVFLDPTLLLLSRFFSGTPDAESPESVIGLSRTDHAVDDESEAGGLEGRKRRGGREGGGCFGCEERWWLRFLELCERRRGKEGI